jgi:hypothetical protein
MQILTLFEESTLIICGIHHIIGYYIVLGCQPFDHDINKVFWNDFETPQITLTRIKDFSS